MMDHETLNSGIVADITDEALSFTARVENEAIERWGFTREQIEADLRELMIYRAMGTTADLAAKIHRPQRAKSLDIQLISEHPGPAVEQCVVRRFENTECRKNDNLPSLLREGWMVKHITPYADGGKRIEYILERRRPGHT